MADHGVVAAANDPARDRGPVADVGVDALEGALLTADGEHIGRIEGARLPGADPVADGRSPQRVLDGEGLEGEAGDHERPARLHHLSLRDRIAPEQIPGDLGGEDGAGGTVAQSRRVVRVCVRQDDRPRLEAADRPEPVEPEIDEDLTAPVGDDERAVPSVPYRTVLDLTARPEEAEPQGRLPRGASRLTTPPRDPVP